MKALLLGFVKSLEVLGHTPCMHTGPVWLTEVLTIAVWWAHILFIFLFYFLMNILIFGY